MCFYDKASVTPFLHILEWPKWNFYC